MWRRLRFALVGGLIGALLGVVTGDPAAPAVLGWLCAVIGFIAGRKRRPDPATVITDAPAPGAWIGASAAGAPEAEALLAAARERGLIDHLTYDRMWSLLWERRWAGTVAAQVPPAPVEVGSVVPAPPVPPPPVPVIGPTAGVDTEPAGTAAAGVPPPAPAAASGFERRLRALRDLIASDLAVHGLTYLGVLFLFVGAFGFVLFSFGSVRVGLRPVAEVAAPAVLLGSARFLRRRGAPFVATALGLLGGVLLPIFLFASFVDGVAVPPDLGGPALVAGLVGVSLATTAGYAWYSMRVPDASVRFLVVPSLWLAVWAAALLFAELPEGGYSLRHWSASQLSIVAATVAVTAVAIRLRPGAPFATATVRAVLPGIAVVYLMTLVLSASEGWPAAPLVVAGMAVLVVTEAVPLPPVVAQVLQPLMLGATIVPLGPAFGTTWAGAVGVVAFIALFEWMDRRRPSIVGAIGAGAGAIVGLAVCAPEPWPCVVGFGVASVWAHARRIRPPDHPWATEVLEVAAAGIPVGAAVGLVLAIDDGVATVVLAAVVAATSVAARIWRRHDTYLGWWVAAAAAVVALYSTSATVEPAAAAAAAGLAGLGLLLAPAPAWAPGWGGPAALAWATWSAAIAAGVGSSGRTLAIAALAAIAVLVSGFALRSIRDLTAHVGGAGLALSGLALALPATGWSRTGVLAAWVVAAGAATLWSEVRDAGPIGLLARTLEGLGRPRLAAIARAAPVIGTAAGLPFLAVELGERTGLTGGRRSWNGVVVAVVGVVEALAARLLASMTARPSAVRSLVAPAAAVAAFFTTLVGISVAAPDPWPTIEALLAPVAVTLILGGALRRPAMTWVAWLASAALAVLLSERAGVEPRDLWIVTFAWGAALLAGGLGVDDVRAGRRAPGDTVRVAWLRPPVALGALAVPASLAFAFRGAPDWYGGWSLVAAALYLAVAVQLRAGAIAAPAAALATVAYATFLPTSPLDEPSLFVPWSAALAAIAIVAGRRTARTRSTPAADPWARWDVGILVVAHGVALTALARAAGIDEVAPTWAAFGALSIVLAGVLRRVEWAVAGALLLIVAAADAGPGWLALTLAATSVACGVAASRAAAPVRWGLQALAALLAAGAWDRFLEWTDWSTPRAVVVTAAAAAALLVIPAIVLKVGRLAVDWAFTFAGLGLAGAAVAAMVARLPGSGMTDRAAGLVAAAGTAAIAVAIGTTASRLQGALQREASAIVAVLAALQLGAAIGSSKVLGAAVAATSGLMAVLVWIGFWRTRPESPWLPSIGIVAIAADLVSLVLATEVLPRRDVLEAALVLSGVECAVAGIALRRPHLVTPAPVFICAAWLVFAADAFAGEVQWFTVPSGVALLAVVSIERRAARLLERGPFPTETLVAEYLGMFLVVASALVETISIGPVRGLVAVAGGAALTSWGGLTRVRRRVWFGAATVLVAFVLMLAGPIARLVPEVRGPALWGLLAAAGFVLIVAATMLERGREKLSAFVRRLDRLMEGWE